MTTGKKGAIIFLWILNILNLLAGFVSQFKILLGKDITSIIPISALLSVNQIMMVNFMTLVLIMVLIAVILTYLVTDIPYSPLEILENFSPLFLIPSVIVMILGIVNAIRADIAADKIWLIVCMIIYILISIIEISCLLTVKQDAE
ncbi:MAG: hypothetical protein PUF01_02445 [Eubacteriales bacterium]|nr:hypothetical protein [Eubacteriales bacterium]